MRAEMRERTSSFQMPTDRLLDVLADTVEKYNWLCHAFCLLDNHYHTLTETISQKNTLRGSPLGRGLEGQCWISQ
ncbi:MAG: hypothetical protein WCA04_07925 [Geobacteraceae bacterium]